MIKEVQEKNLQFVFILNLKNILISYKVIR